MKNPLRGTLKRLPEALPKQPASENSVDCCGRGPGVRIIGFPACMPLDFPRNSGRRAGERTGIHNEAAIISLYGKGSPENRELAALLRKNSPCTGYSFYKYALEGQTGIPGGEQPDGSPVFFLRASYLYRLPQESPCVP